MFPNTQIERILKLVSSFNDNKILEKFQNESSFFSKTTDYGPEALLEMMFHWNPEIL